MTEEFKPYKTDDMGDHYQHPTFGVINISRGHGPARPLFGSSILHHNVIILEISHAKLTRSLSTDWIFSRDRIIEVEMSPTQFADAITALNCGSGTPVTIRRIHANHQDTSNVDPPFQSKVQQFNKEFEEHITELAGDFDAVIQMAAQAKVSQKLQKAIEGLKQQFKNNLPFIAEQFSNQIERTVVEAKGEVEAFVNRAVQQYGLDAIRKQAPQLPEVTETKQLQEGK